MEQFQLAADSRMGRAHTVSPTQPRRTNTTYVLRKHIKRKPLRIHIAKKYMKHTTKARIQTYWIYRCLAWGWRLTHQRASWQACRRVMAARCWLTAERAGSEASMTTSRVDANRRTTQADYTHSNSAVPNSCLPAEFFWKQNTTTLSVFTFSNTTHSKQHMYM